MTFEEYEASQNGGQPDASIDKLDFSQIPDEEELGDDLPKSNPDESSETPDQKEVDEKADDDQEEQPDSDTKEKKVQTPEENAKFAEQRRAQQVERRVQEELAKLQSTNPAFKLAQTLEKLYGVPVDQIQAKIEEGMIAEEAKQRNVSPEQVRQERNEVAARTQTQAELSIAQFQLWNHRIDAEAIPLKQNLPMITDEDVMSAKAYMIDVLKNPNLPLEQAIYAVHGSKITQSLQSMAKNDALAEVSGRAANSLPPSGGKGAQPTILTDEEKWVAKNIFKMSEEDYAKYK
jgi:hypothetical protein